MQHTTKDAKLAELNARRGRDRVLSIGARDGRRLCSPSQCAKIFEGVRVISRRRLREFWETHPRAEVSLRTWFKVVSTAIWQDFAHLRQSYPSADQVGRLVVFNIGGNRFRLTALVDYGWQKVFVRRVITHEEYDDGDWKRDPWL